MTTDPTFKIGSHDTGYWFFDTANNINAKKTPAKTDLSVEEAIEFAKNDDGAELVIVNKQGRASVYDLELEDSGWKENKKILISELDRDPDKDDAALVINDYAAQEFSGGHGAFLVDQDKKSTFLGGDVDRTNAKAKLKYAEEYLNNNPTQDQINTAYAIAKDAGDERHVDKKLASQVLEQLKKNYRQTNTFEPQIGLLKDGAPKTQMQKLLGELKTLTGQESTRVGELTQQLATRTDKWKTDLAQPTEKRNKALSAWTSANEHETQLVATAAYNLREARFPNVHLKESNLEAAEEEKKTAKKQWDSAATTAENAQEYLTKIEALPGQAETLLEKAKTLTTENQNMYVNIQTYTTLTLLSVASDLSDVEDDIRDTQSDLDRELNKPDKEQDSYTISRLEGNLRTLKSKHDDLDSRESSLTVINLRLAFTKDIDQLSLLFADLGLVDRLALMQYKNKKDANQKAIKQHKESAQNKTNEYNREITGAKQDLKEANRKEASAKSHFEQKQTQVTTLDTDLQTLLSNPRPDTHPEVKPKFTAHDKAVTHKENTVGAKATLTVTRDKTQGVVDGINTAYQTEKRDIEGKISNIKQTLLNEATGKINQVEGQIKK